MPVWAPLVMFGSVWSWLSMSKGKVGQSVNIHASDDFARQRHALWESFMTLVHPTMSQGIVGHGITCFVLWNVSKEMKRKEKSLSPYALTHSYNHRCLEPLISFLMGGLKTLSLSNDETSFMHLLRTKCCSLVFDAFPKSFPNKIAIFLLRMGFFFIIRVYKAFMFPSNYDWSILIERYNKTFYNFQNSNYKSYVCIKWNYHKMSI